MLFDHDGDGSLTPAELYGGLDWLGVKMTPAKVADVFSLHLSLAKQFSMFMFD